MTDLYRAIAAYNVLTKGEPTDFKQRYLDDLIESVIEHMDRDGVFVTSVFNAQIQQCIYREDTGMIRFLYRALGCHMLDDIDGPKEFRHLWFSMSYDQKAEMLRETARDMEMI